MKFECVKADLDFIAAREQFLAAQASGDRQWIKRAAVALATDVYFGRAQTILLQRERIKQATIRNRRLQHQKQAA